MKKEGVVGLWVGYPTFYFRIAPHVMITLMCNDFLNDFGKKFWLYKNKVINLLIKLFILNPKFIVKF